MSYNFLLDSNFNITEFFKSLSDIKSYLSASGVILGILFLLLYKFKPQNWTKRQYDFWKSIIMWLFIILLVAIGLSFAEKFIPGAKNRRLISHLYLNGKPARDIEVVCMENEHYRDWTSGDFASFEIELPDSFKDKYITLKFLFNDDDLKIDRNYLIDSFPKKIEVSTNSTIADNELINYDKKSVVPSTTEVQNLEIGDNIVINGVLCPMSGSASSGTVAYSDNMLRNRYAIPEASEIDKTITLNSLLGNGTDDQNNFSPEKAVTITGYVSSVKIGGVETANCKTINPYYRDAHIEIVADLKENLPSKRMIIEVTPRIRLIMAKQGIDWSTENLRNLLTGHKVTVTGWLFFDSMHRTESYNYDKNDEIGRVNWRATCWEVHPVTQIEVIN